MNPIQAEALHALTRTHRYRALAGIRRHRALTRIDRRHGATNRTTCFRSSLSRISLPVIAICLAGCVAGCVCRTLKITTEPPQALVYLNDQEVGRSAVETDFLWYGDYDVTIRKEGYQTLQTHWNITAPWYQRIPLDFFFEVLWPGRLHDVHERRYVLLPTQPVDPEALIERAMVTRDRALEPKK